MGSEDPLGVTFHNSTLTIVVRYTVFEVLTIEQFENLCFYLYFRNGDYKTSRKNVSDELGNSEENRPINCFLQFLIF